MIQGALGLVMPINTLPVLLNQEENRKTQTSCWNLPQSQGALVEPASCGRSTAIEPTENTISRQVNYKEIVE